MNPCEDECDQMSRESRTVNEEYHFLALTESEKNNYDDGKIKKATHLNDLLMNFMRGIVENVFAIKLIITNFIFIIMVPKK